MGHKMLEWLSVGGLGDHMKPGDASMSMVDRAGAVTGKVKVSDYLVLVGGTNCVTEENVGRLGPTRT
ncbi:hypothetical protein J6590_105154 [Homalodisca vitripennis]|nr:hypothetical protein J6590_105154 [Homalodisca vitripennis]